MNIQPNIYYFPSKSACYVFIDVVFKNLGYQSLGFIAYEKFFHVRLMGVLDISCITNWVMQ